MAAIFRSKRPLSLSLLFLLFACGRTTNDEPQWILEKDKPVPEFRIEVHLTDRASKILADSGETIRGSVTFDGDGSLPDRGKTSPFRDVFLGSHEFELRGSRKIRIDDAMIAQSAYARLSDKNYHFTINVFSGRRVFEHNVLDGGYAAIRLESLREDESIELTCDLLDLPSDLGPN